MFRVVLTTLWAAALAVFAMQPAIAGTISGEVKFTDALPKLPPVIVSKDQDYCGEILPNEIYSIDATGGLRNVVVFLENAPTKASPNAQKLNVIENSGCRYSPRIYAMQKGERLQIKNTDPKLHIPHSYLQDRTVFMLSLPFRNTILEATQKIKEAGILKLVCDTHAWMLGYIHVFDHPYFAVTDERGIFSIPNVPPGTYTLKAWHEDGGMKVQEISVGDSKENKLTVEFGRR